MVGRVAGDNSSSASFNYMKDVQETSTVLTHTKFVPFKRGKRKGRPWHCWAETMVQQETGSICSRYSSYVDEAQLVHSHADESPSPDPSGSPTWSRRPLRFFHLIRLETKNLLKWSSIDANSLLERAKFCTNSGSAKTQDKVSTAFIWVHYFPCEMGIHHTWMGLYNCWFPLIIGPGPFNP